MNITDSKEQNEIIAKTCGCKNRREVSYSFEEAYYNPYMDKKNIILSEIFACERLKNCAQDELDSLIIEKEITELKQIMDLLA